MTTETNDEMKKKILPVTVVIPTMNRPESLTATVKSYLSASYVPGEIVVVDQSGKDEDRTIIRKAVESCDACAVKGIYIRLEQPSTTVSRNIGAASASNDIILYSDDDIEVENDTVFQIYSLMNNPEYAMAEGNIFPRRKIKMSTRLFVCISGRAAFWKLGIGHVSPGMFAWMPWVEDEDIETDWARGCFFAVRRSLADKWNISWDIKMSGYAFAEDMDYTMAYSRAARREKLRCVIAHKARLYHLCSREYRIPDRQMAARIVINRLYLFYKHGGGFFGRLALEWCNFMMLFSMLLKGGAANHWAAMKYCYKHEKEIRNGELAYE